MEKPLFAMFNVVDLCFGRGKGGNGGGKFVLVGLAFDRVLDQILEVGQASQASRPSDLLFDLRARRGAVIGLDHRTE